ncbi:hypothetical protein GH714_027071 [Hevea brasiliensis]|uniref:ZF-HD dimerization-type domain-containing protein n=1 Tax=Hevea brasiliensis TaxID=3981 RepID=A0A6A6N3S1_HEVBR|nr:hypothetical protein GH714_027071 [Hevea brasiliensis]
MELSSHEEEIPIPINSSYGGAHGHGHGHMIHHDHPATHNHIIPSSALQMPSNNGSSSIPSALEDHHAPFKKMVRYRECLKNHAAAMGGNATDGCGEFMPSGEEGSIEALTCSACNCHRNFHRKEIEGEASSCDCYHSNPHFSRVGRRVILGHHKNILAPEALGPAQLVKKRFRTKFTQEQKEKMLNFAEKVGWKIQKQEEAVVQQFCQEIGVKRRVLKKWIWIAAI